MTSINLFGSFSKDVWDLKTIPNKKLNSLFLKSKKINSTLDFTSVKDEHAKKLLKEFFYVELITKEFKKDTYIRNYFAPYRNMINYLSRNSDFEKYKILLDPSMVDFRENTQFIDKIIHFEKEKNAMEIFDLDRWKMDNITISPYRKNNSSYVQYIYFKHYAVDENKDIIKKFIKNLLLLTDEHLSTIVDKKGVVESFEKSINKPFVEINRSDIEKYLINLKHLNNRTYVKKVSYIKNLLDYLLLNEIIAENFIYPTDYKKINHKQIKRFVEQTTIDQIYNHLEKLDYQTSTMFLLLNCNGMRISEICLLEKNCLSKTETGTYITFFQQKMNKYISNPISQELFKALEIQRKNIVNKFGHKEKFMFPLEKNKPYLSKRFIREMKEFCSQYKIIKDKGEIYKFKCHDFRHTFATNLINRNVPSHIIQRLLGHKSIEMTLTYIEIQDQRKKETYKNFINVNGNRKSLSGNTDVTDIQLEMQWLKKSMNLQALPNGMCALPIGLGSCPHANSCLTCEKYFRTSKEHLETHKNQLEKTREILKVSRENKWSRQIETNEKVERNLLNIIHSLEAE